MRRKKQADRNGAVSPKTAARPQMLKTGLLQLLEEMPATEAEKDAYIKELQFAIRDMSGEIEDLKEMLAYMRKRMYGSKSEKTPLQPEPSQLGMFNEAEQENAAVKDDKVVEPLKKDKRGWHKKDPKEKKKWTVLGNKEIKTNEQLLDLDEGDKVCSVCGSALEYIGQEFVREEPRFIPARIEINRISRKTYCCPCCKKQGYVRIQKPSVPKPLLNHSTASAEVVTEVMYQKYVMATPLYRQEQQWADMGIGFSRTTMANWIIRCSQDWLEPVYEALHKELLTREVLHADETPVQVLKEPGKRAESKSYMWVYRTGKSDPHPVVLYDYRPGRSGEYPKEFLQGFAGYLHTDGYSGYNKVPNIIRCGCWAHVRRKFVEALPPTTDSGASPSPAEIGRGYCDRLFAAEKEIEKLPVGQRKQARLESEEGVLRAFWGWLEELNKHPLGGKLRMAVEYALNQRPYLENYLLDARCSLSNNLAENAIRPFTVGRKNWLFSSSVEGARASAIVYSLVETAKANNRDIKDYLRLLLESLPNLDIRAHQEQLSCLLPWSDEIQKWLEEESNA